MNLFTRIIATLRYPESALGKTLHRIIPIFLFVILLVFGLSWFATYRIVIPDKLDETIDPSSFLLRNFSSVRFTTPDKKDMEGWFIPSIRGAPAVFLCHGYRSNRAELLTMASTFQENGYHVFLFDFRGHGSSAFNLSTLGVKETGDLLSAIEVITARPDVDPNRVGVWGVSLGAYVALSAAVSSPKIRTIAVDSPFESPNSFVEMETTEALGVDNFAFRKLSMLGFVILNLPNLPGRNRLLERIVDLEGRDKLFITSEGATALESQTLNLFNHSPQPRELLRLKHSKTSILYDVDRKNYENIVVEFFKKHLPLRNSRL